MCLFGLFQERLNNEQMSCAGIEDKMPFKFGLGLFVSHGLLLSKTI